MIVAVSPLIGIAGKLQMDAFTGFQEANKRIMEKAGGVMSEAFGGIRTVYAFGLQERISSLYARELEIPMQNGAARTCAAAALACARSEFDAGMKRGHIGGLGFGFSQFIMLGVSRARLVVRQRALMVPSGACCSRVRPRVLRRRALDQGRLAFVREHGAATVHAVVACRRADRGTCAGRQMQALMAVMMSAMGVGQMAALLGDVAKARVGAGSIFELVDRVSKIDPSSHDGHAPSSSHGAVAFRGVSFAYPQRPDVTVLDDFSLEVAPGETVALVGCAASGRRGGGDDADPRSCAQAFRLRQEHCRAAPRALL